MTLSINAASSQVTD